tara:strand:- start:224 stop:448 length:225 start_codon:yes stop_codon:yes gene_type:complete
MEQDFDYEEHWENNFHCDIRMGIEETKLFYDWVCFSLEMWPGSPRRPIEEQQWLYHMKNRLFAVIMDYQFQMQD